MGRRWGGIETSRTPAAVFVGPTIACPSSPEWLSRKQASIVYGVSVDLRRRNRARRGSRIVGRLIRVRVDDLDRLFRPIPTGRPPLRKAW